MKPLPLRIALTLAVLALVGFGIVDVFYLFDEQGKLARERRHELAWVATTVVADIKSGQPVDALVRRVGADRRMVVTLVGDHTVQSEPHPEFASFIYASAPLVAKGYEHLAVPVDVAPWTAVVVSRPLKETIDMVLGEQPRVVFIFLVVAALMTLVGLGMMRNSVLRPIERSEADRRQLEQQMTELVRAERLAAVGRLAAGLAHEVGNPLAVLTGYTSILRDDALPKATRDDALTRMDKELTRIQGTVRGLLDYARAPSGVSGSTAIAVIVEHVVKLAEVKAKSKAATISTAIEDATIAMSGDALTQVLLNLVLNALDAVPKDARIVISASGGVITVDDSGPGIAAEHAAKLFEPFFTTKPAGVGTGLGLSVCESLVTAAHGTITAGRSPTLGGARFVITLPRAS
jgi:two-component system NtrC family sensor kinase